MKNNLMTEAQAIEAAGAELVKKVQLENCEPTSRCMQAHEEDEIEFSACVQDADGKYLTAYYYVDKTWVDSLEDDVNWLDLVDWTISGYTYD